MATSTADPSYINTNTQSRAPPTVSSTRSRISFRRWLRLHQFHLISAALAASTAVTVYRMYEQSRVLDVVDQRSAELDIEYSRVQRLSERRRQTVQQQLHSLWAKPPTAASTTAPSAVVCAPSAGGWLSWSGWRRWWRGGSADNLPSAAVHTRPLSSLQLPLCGSSIHVQQLASLSTTRVPSVAYMAAVITDCDHLLHTGTLPTTSPFAASTVTTSSDSTPLASTTTAPSNGAAGSAVSTIEHSVTGGGKRLLF